MSAWDLGYGPLIETTMRVATWNLWGRYGPWEARQPIIEDSLRSIDADVVCLQEAWDDEHVSQPDSDTGLPRPGDGRIDLGLPGPASRT